MKVHVGGNVVHTGQLFFPDALTDQVYKATPYRARGNPDITDAADSIYRNGGSRSLLDPSRAAVAISRQWSWAYTPARLDAPVPRA